jgi:hypothetical protein
VRLVVSPRHEKVARQELTFTSSISGETGGLSKRELPPLSGPLLCENTAGGAEDEGGRSGRGWGRPCRRERRVGAGVGAAGGGAAGPRAGAPAEACDDCFGPGGRHGREKGD